MVFFIVRGGMLFFKRLSGNSFFRSLGPLATRKLGVSGSFFPDIWLFKSDAKVTQIVEKVTFSFESLLSNLLGALPDHILTNF